MQAPLIVLLNTAVTALVLRAFIRMPDRVLRISLWISLGATLLSVVLVAFGLVLGGLIVLIVQILILFGIIEYSSLEQQDDPVNQPDKE